MNETSWRLWWAISGLFRLGFGIFVLMIASFMLFQDLDQEMLNTIHEMYLAHKEFVLGAVNMMTIYIFYRLRVWIHAKSA